MTQYGFSFGYKNHPDPFANKNPGPGSYYFETSSIKKVPKNTSRYSPTRSRIREVQDFNPKEERTNNHQQRIKGPTMTNSHRLKSSLILPWVSKGPQSYTVNKDIGDCKKGINFEKYSKRVFNYSNFVPGVGTYNSAEQPNYEQSYMSKNIQAFRKLSHVIIPVAAQLSPGYYERNNYLSKDKSFKFSIQNKYPPLKKQTPCVTEYFTDLPSFTSDGPQHSIPKNMPNKTNYYKIVQKKLQENPSPQSYNSLRSFNKAVSASRSMKFSKGDRMPNNSHLGPGPGQYEITPQKSFSQNQNDRVESSSQIQERYLKVKLTHLRKLLENKKITQDQFLQYSTNQYTLDEVYKIVEPGPGEYSPTKNSSDTSQRKVSTLQNYQRKLEIDNPFSIRNEYTPGPQYYNKQNSVEKSRSTKFSKLPRPEVFKITQTPSPGQYNIPPMTFVRKPLPKKREVFNLEKIQMENIVKMAAALFEYEEN